MVLDAGLPDVLTRSVVRHAERHQGLPALTLRTGRKIQKRSDSYVRS